MIFASRNPATGEPIAEYPLQSADEVERRLALAWETWQQWRRVPLAERAAALVRIAERLEAGVDAYARLITTEMGKPLAEAEAEIRKCAATCRHYAEHGPSYLDPAAVATGTSETQVVYEPLGPVFAVMPWNYPFWQVMRFFVPAALAGNTALVKHAETVQGCAQALEALVREAGCPAGLLQNLVIDHATAAAIIADPRVSSVTLTGSVRAGRAVAAVAGAAGKKLVLELGGSDPFIVLADADLERAAEVGIAARFGNAGQSCIAAKRFLLARPIAADFLGLFTERARALRVGDPLAPETRMGPLARGDLRDALDRQVRAAVAAGATVRLGGAPLAGAGSFYPPTILTGLAPDAPVAQEEIFGPVATVFEFADEDEAVAIANGTEFGLGAAVWSRDLARARRVAARLEAGAVFINDLVRSDARAPFGGIKASGYGRELGAIGAREFTNAKLLWVA